MKPETRTTIIRWCDKLMDIAHSAVMAWAFVLAILNNVQGDRVYAMAALGVGLGLLALRRQEKASATAREIREARELIEAMRVSGLVVGTPVPMSKPSPVLTDEQYEALKRKWMAEFGASAKGGAVD